MFLNCVNGAVVAQHTARQNSILLSSVAKQRAKEIATNGESSIRKVRPLKIRAQSCPSAALIAPLSSKNCVILDDNTNLRGSDSEVTHLTTSSKDDAITKVKHAIVLVKSTLVEVVEDRDMNMKLAILRYKETKEKASPTASRIGK